MKLSPETFSILNNFAKINPDLIINPGSEIHSLAISRHIYANAIVVEEFPRKFGVRDLGKFLNVLQSHLKRGEAELSFGKDEEGIRIKNIGKGRTATTHYRYGDMRLIKSEPPGKINFKHADVEFDLSDETFKWMWNIGSIIGAPNFVFESAEDTIQVNACDVEGKVVDSSTLTIDDYAGTPFKFVLKTENMKILNGDYKVQLSKDGLAKFTHRNMKLFYYIAIEQKSSKYG